MLGVSASLARYMFMDGPQVIILLMFTSYIRLSDIGDDNRNAFKNPTIRLETTKQADIAIALALATQSETRKAGHKPLL